MASPREALIVGFGSIGRRHLENLYRLGVRRFGLVRRRPDPPDGLHLPEADIAVYTDLDTALAQGYGLAVVCNPSSLHVATASACLAAGCAVYLEKPVAAARDGVDALAARAAGRTLAVGCQFRFHPQVEQMHRWIRAGRIGAPLHAHIEVGQYLPDWHPGEDFRAGYAARPELGGGVVLTLIHEIDYANWLLGPLRVAFAAGGAISPLAIPVEDVVAATLLTAETRPVQLAMDYWRRPAQRRLSIVGTAGHLQWDYFAGTLVFTDREGNAEAGALPPGWTRNDMFLAGMADFLAAAAGRGAPRTPLADGIAALDLALAIKAAIA